MDHCHGLPPEVQALLLQWKAQPEGALLTTHSSWLLPVRWRNVDAMLKVARTPDERRGYDLMRWWDGQGAARVLAFAGDALLLERATGHRRLAEMAWSGRDEEACRILCEAVAALHAPRRPPLPELHPLEAWFRPLFESAGHDARLARAASIARKLLSEQQDVRPLHGDLHHDNVLDFGECGWLAIDPHGLVGERLFDFANIFTNPDLGDYARPPLATSPARLEARLKIVAEQARIDPTRMLQWIVAWTGLSAAWFIEDGDAAGAAVDFAVNDIAYGLLAP